MKTKIEYLEEIKRLLKEYLTDVDNSGLSPLSAKIYQTQAVNFVKWIEGGFDPGWKKRQLLISRRRR
jgi:hypothetical protein